MKTYLHGGMFSGSLLFTEGSCYNIVIVTVSCSIGLAVTYIIDFVYTVHIVKKRLCAYDSLDVF
jgi:hypothetical protein